MSRAAVSLALGGVLIMVFLAWVTWTHIFTRVDRTFWLLLLGYGSVGSQKRRVSL